LVTNFASLLTPVSTGELVSAVTNRRRLFVRADDRRRFDRLLPWSTINLLLSAKHFGPHQLEVRRDGTAVSPLMYREKAEQSCVRLDALQALAYQGVSIVINGVDRLVPTVSAVTTLIERHLQRKAWANAYLTFHRNGAFRPHWDSHDVLVLHLSGRKRWRCHGIGAGDPSAFYVFDRGTDPGPVAWEEVLEPGDVLYLPRGEIHAAAVEPDDVSLHLTIGLDAAVTEPNAPLGHRPAANLGLSNRIEPGTWLRCALRRRVPLPTAGSAPVDIAIAGATYRLMAPAVALLAVLQEADALTLTAAQATLSQHAMDDVRLAAGELARHGLVFVD
jgi:hypothetical protein